MRKNNQSQSCKPQVTKETTNYKLNWKTGTILSSMVASLFFLTAFSCGGSNKTQKESVYEGIREVTVRFSCAEHEVEVSPGKCECEDTYTRNELGFCVPNLCLEFTETACKIECKATTGDITFAEEGKSCGTGQICDAQGECVCDVDSGHYGEPGECLCDNSRGYYGEPGNCQICDERGKEIQNNECVSICPEGLLPSLRDGSCTICENGNVYLPYDEDPCQYSVEGCSSNDDCSDQEYCHLEGETCEHPTKGTCKYFGAYTDALPGSAAADALGVNLRISSNNARLNWWAADNWCKAQGMELIDVEKFKCYRDESSYVTESSSYSGGCCVDQNSCFGLVGCGYRCTTTSSTPSNFSDPLKALRSTFGESYWVWTASNSASNGTCSAFSLGMQPGYLLGMERDDNYHYIGYSSYSLQALCQFSPESECAPENEQYVDDITVCCNANKTPYCTQRDSSGACTAAACCSGSVMEGSGTNGGDLCCASVQTPYCSVRDTEGKCTAGNCCPKGGKVIPGVGPNGAGMCYSAQDMDCVTNADCDDGYYCNITATSCYPNAGTCEPINDVAFTTADIDGVGTVYKSDTRMNWWTADHLCKAKGMHLIAAEDLNCYPSSSNSQVKEGSGYSGPCCKQNTYCTYYSSNYAPDKTKFSTVLRSIDEAFSGISFWTTSNASTTDSCKAFSSSLYDYSLYGTERSSAYSYALCISD